jgi:hypothetical protein
LSYLSSVDPKGGGGNFFLALVPTGGFIIAAGIGGGTGYVIYIPRTPPWIKFAPLPPLLFVS